MQAIVITETGGPEVLVATETPDPKPAPGEVLVVVEHAGLNFIDTYKRGGLYPMTLPFILGEEAGGVVEAVGKGVTGFADGDRVAWSGVMGADAELAAVPADRLVAVPDEVPLDLATAALLQGMTAHYLVNDTYPLRADERCLVHAGAGGAGRLLVQFAKAKGAEVIATAGSDEKLEVARSAGADHVVNYETEDWVEAVEAIAGPRSVDVVYDGVGATTFDGGLAVLRPRGMMVTYGNASGAVPPLEPLRLMREASIYLTRPTLVHYVAAREDLELRAGAVFSAIAAGDLDVLVGDRYPLSDVAAAHRVLEARQTVGKILIEPGAS